jgi:4-hydroxyacetophenone monooxygenase
MSVVDECSLPMIAESSNRDALEHADLRVLLMVLFHHSGDRRWLEALFQPSRDVNLIADEQAGKSPPAAHELREAAVKILTSPVDPAVGDPGDALMTELMSTCLGEAVPPECAPMMREETGFCSRQVVWSKPNAPGTQDSGLQVLVVGAGASGLAMGANLCALGIRYRILEKNVDVRGTWHVNHYPGCGVDTPNHAYSFSFKKRYRWHRYFAARDQLHDYLKGAAEEPHLLDRIAFRTRVTGARFDAAIPRWRVKVEAPDGPETLTAQFFVSAIGQLSDATVPVIDGLKQFEGAPFHTSQWPQDLDLPGKRVAVVGTGATAMQVVTTIADDVEQLTVYQRSAQWARDVLLPLAA